MEELVAKKYLELGVSPEIVTHLDIVELDFQKESLSSTEHWRILGVFPNSRKKSTYRSPDGKSPIRNPDWESIMMGSFDFEDDPFR